MRDYMYSKVLQFILRCMMRDKMYANICWTTKTVDNYGRK
jgi:hypothetical protein